MADGDLSDWGGTTSIAADPAGDASGNDDAADLRALFVVLSSNELFFRIDVTDLENQPPVANAQSVSTLEDTAVVIILTGSDPNGDPLTFAIGSGPSQGTLGAITQLTPTSAQVTYSPNANYFGPDAFTFTTNDGQVSSPAATVSITVTPVNDAPSFVAANPAAVNEDAGSQSAAFATFSAGPANESGQAVLAYAVTGVSNAALFAAGPSIANDGTLSYTPAADANGSSDFTVTVQDDGGTTNGGVDTSVPQTFTITVNPVNDAPSFVVGPNQTVLEDAAAQVVNPWATAISAGPPDEAGQTLSFAVTNNTNAALFAVVPAISPAGVLSYTPAANAAGVATISLTLMDNGGTANGGIDTSAAQSFTITISGVNDAPSFTAGPNQTVNEDAGAQTVNPWATAINDGDPEVTQGLTFQITNNTNAALFSAGPAVSPTGVLTYTPAVDANGVATITLQLMDDGGTANGGVNASPTQMFAITVSPVNDAPSFTASNPPTVLEDAAPVSIAAWASFNPGPADEAGQAVLGYTVSAIGTPALFATAPAVATNGTLSYTLAANANGSSSFTVTVQDDGGTANGGVDTSAPQTFTVTVTAVNDEPSFTAGPNVSVNEDAGAQSAAWATAISAGPADESGQTLNFNLTNTNNALFLVQPSVSATGVLSFTSAANANGVATVTINLMDNGGTANGGDDLSPDQMFTITVTAVNDPPVNVVPGAQNVDEDGTLAFTGPAAISVSDLDIAAGALSVDLSVSNGTLSVVAAGAASVTNNATAAVQVSGAIADVNATVASLSYAPTANYAGPDSLSVSSNDNGNTGSGGMQTDSDVIAITVNAINDAPVNTVPGIQNVAGGMLEFSTVGGNAISVLDVDADPGNVQVDLSVTAGTLDAVVTAGVTISNNGTAAVTLVGLQTDVNLALDGLIYVAAGAGTDTLTMLSDDLGNTGAGGPLTDTDTVTLLIDEPPTVSATPANGVTTASGPPVIFTFSEFVNIQPGAFTVACAPSGAGITSIAVGVANSVNFPGSPADTGQPGDTCTITVISTLVTDVDLIDPPNELDGDNSGDSIDGDADNFVSTYTVDSAPALVSTSPMNGATVASTAVVMISFNEPVDFGMGGFTLDCGGPIAVTPSGSGTPTLTFTPVAPLPAGSSCTATLLAANVDDSDSFDPPANPAADVIVNFDVDAAPSFVSSTPANGGVASTTQTISFTFSENVDDLGSAIQLLCGGVVPGVITGSGTPTLTFTPDAPLTPGASCIASVGASNVGDTDLFDPPQNLTTSALANFTVDQAPDFSSSVPANNAINVGLSANLSVTFTEQVNFTASAFTLNCPAGSPIPFTVSGSGTSTATIDPTPSLPINTLCVLTVNDPLVTDVDAADPPNAGTGITTISFTTVNDSAPRVSSVTPANAAPTGIGNPVLIGFNEAVDLAANAITIACSPSGASTSVPGSAVASTPALFLSSAPGQAGDTCTITVLSTLVTDADANDPPNELDGDSSGDTNDGDADNFVSTYIVDSAPSVSSILPGSGSTNQGSTMPLTITFSEAVTASPTAFTVDCPVGSPAPFITSGGPTVFTLTPNAPGWPAGVTCTVTVVATQISDNDIFDPPQDMVVNFSSTFSTDAAPTVSVTPPENAVVSNNQTFTATFSEPVNLSGTSVTLLCGVTPIPFSSVPVLPATNTSTLVVTPTTPFMTIGAACALTLVANQVSDTDANDPPDNLPANLVRNVTVDAAPTVVATTPTNGATDVNPTSPISIDFSESVNFSTLANAANTSFDLECPAGSPVNFTVVSASPNDPVVLNPDDNEIAGQTCSLTVLSSGITDADLLDPPDDMAANFVASFSFGAVANDDVRAVTPNLTNTTALGAAELDDNDILGAGVITSFGFGVCTGTPAGTQLDAGAANGRLTINANGTFSYEPPAGVPNATRTFCYTVTGGDTANVAFNIANTELVWFANASAAAGGNGTQARPFQTLTQAATVDTANDTIFVFPGNYSGAAISLEAGERLVGDDANATLAAISGVAPVSGSQFPTLTGTAPVISCAGVCITLGTGNTLNGFTIGNSGAAGTDLAGSGFGTLNVAEVTLTGDGRALNLVTGTLDGNFLDIDASGSVGGILLDAVGGTFTVTGTANVTTSSASADTVNIGNAPAAASATFIGGITASQTGSASAIRLGVNNATAVINLGVINLTTSNGIGLFMTNTHVTFTGNTSVIAATGGSAIVGLTAVFDAPAVLASASSTNSSATGFNFNNVTGSLTMNGGAVTNPTGIAFQGLNNLGTLTYAGTLTKTTGGQLVQIGGATGTGSVTLSGNLSCTGACAGFTVNNRTAGSFTFSGATKTLTNVFLDNNTGSTIDFTNGGLAITTTSINGFHATGGGTVTVQGSGNTIASTTGTALNVANTTIGASNLNFQSISTNGSVNGINLDSTGAAGGLVVSGNNNATLGGDSSGGTFRTTGDAIRLVSTRGISLTNIRIANVGTGPTDEAGGIDATNLQGTNLLRANTITDMGKAGGTGGTNRNAVSVINTNTNLTQFTVENSVFSNSEGTSSFIFTSARFASDMSISVTGSDFFNLVPVAVQVNAGDEDSGVHTVTSNISNNTFRNAHVSNGQGGIIVATADQDATHNFTIAGNQFFDLIKGIAGGNSEIVATQTTGGALVGTISGNTLGTTAFANGDRRGIGVVAEPDLSANGELGSVDVVIEGNFINRLPTREAIFVDLREDTGNSELIIRNNNIGNLAGYEGQVGGTREAIDVQTRGEVARTLGLLIANNNVRSNTDTPFATMNLEVNIDNATPGNLTMNATVTGNSLTNTGTGNELFARARDAGAVTTLCLNMSGNTVGAGAGVLDLDDVGVLNVQQASAAALAAANGIPAGNVVISSGAPAFGVACPAPPL